MNLVALNCPQCSAPLPRVALWRSVKCQSCGALITRGSTIVSRESFRQAWLRSRAVPTAGSSFECRGTAYQIERQLGTGESSTVHLARRLGIHPLLVTAKISSTSTGTARIAREAGLANALQTLGDPGSQSYFSRLLPDPVAFGPIDSDGGRHALLLRHPTGFWGSLADLADRFPSGLDPRHGVWIWRRLLELLGFLHRNHWCHGDIRPEHVLVDPEAHATRFVGWADASPDAPPATAADDLARSARVVQFLLNDAAGNLRSDVPQGLADLLARAAGDIGFCMRKRADGLDDELRAEAAKAFGPPTFVPLHL